MVLLDTPGALVAAHPIESLLAYIGLYVLLIGVALLNPQGAWKYSIRGVALLAGVANILGVIDMARFGAYCFYCLLTTALTPFLVWMAFLL